MLFSGAWWKKLKQKISWHWPFNIMLWEEDDRQSDIVVQRKTTNIKLWISSGSGEY